ncbi:uncharacterized protein LOC108202116 [Daucus carota subsp. sativus]|uniref:uncharacterized protein LOC108202116 n=1 Tax=Daucus carota subsp. sativus TaxID=79200 RepID=UPI0007EFC0C0|nr:PREDICTED: uncharacterized protein LOC108202116 isoform X2 [Daucus carota subsp. sativus]
MGEEIEMYRDVEDDNSRGLRHSLVLFWMRTWNHNHCKFTIDANRSRLIGCDEEDQRTLLHYWSHFANSVISSAYAGDIPKGVIKRVFDNSSAEMSPNIKYYSEEEYPHRDFALTCGIRASFCFLLSPIGVMEIVSTRNQDVGTLHTFYTSLEKWGYSSYNFRHSEKNTRTRAKVQAGWVV